MMKIEVWSDIACPFCYIGKAHLEKALASSGKLQEIEVIYKSYQLDPDYSNTTGENAVTHLSTKKGMPVEQVNEMMRQITQMGKAAGLNFNFEKNLPANTYDAHRLIHLAMEEKCDIKVLDLLYHAYFVTGKNIEREEVLKEIGLEAGIGAEKLTTMLNSHEYAYEVKQDILASRNLGIRGVPFFVFNEKYALSGAQPVNVFEEVITKSFNEWRQDNPAFIDVSTDDGAACTDDSCEV